MRKTRFPIIALLLWTLALFGACSRVSAPDDSAITEAIQAKLFKDQTLKTRDISIITQGGIVVLTGQVQTEKERAAAEELARQAQGVKDVVNKLEIPSRKTAASRAAEHGTSTALGAAEEPAPPPPPVRITIPAGTAVSVQMIDGIDSKTSQPGTEFAASLVSPVAAGERVVFSSGSDVRVRLVGAKQAGRIKGSSELHVELAALSRGGEYIQVQSGPVMEKGSSRGKQTAKRTAAGALIGGVIGGIAGGKKGLAIGAGAGAGSGLLVQAVTKGPKVQIPPEAKLDFTLTEPVTVTLPTQAN